MILNDHCAVTSQPSFQGCWLCERVGGTVFSPDALTCSDIHDVVEGILPLNNIDHQFGKSNVVLSHVRIYSHRLHNIIHQEQALCVLQDSLSQVLVRAVITQRPTLNMKD